jgi:hypothetical protein
MTAAHHQYPHLLLGEEAAKELGEGQPHGSGLQAAVLAGVAAGRECSACRRDWGRGRARSRGAEQGSVTGDPKNTEQAGQGAGRGLWALASTFFFCGLLPQPPPFLKRDAALRRSASSRRVACAWRLRGHPTLPWGAERAQRSAALAGRAGCRRRRAGGRAGGRGGAGRAVHLPLPPEPVAWRCASPYGCKSPPRCRRYAPVAPATSAARRRHRRTRDVRRRRHRCRSRRQPRRHLRWPSQRRVDARVHVRT